MSHKITGGMRLVVGRVAIGFGGVSREFGGVLGGSRGVKGGLLDPYRTLFAPLEVLCGTRFGSKQHIMIQMAHFNRVGITDPIPDRWNPLRDSQKAISSANKAF